MVGDEFKEILSKALKGKIVNAEEGYSLIDIQSNELPQLLSVANILRIRTKGRTMSFSKKVFIPLTNLCRNACKYCGFRKNPESEKGGFLESQTVLEIAEKGRKAGCNEALFTLGERPEEKYPEAKRQLKKLGYSNTVEYLRDMCKKVLEKTKLLPHSNPGILAKDEVASLKEVNASLGLMLENVSERLCKENGPHEFSPGKRPSLRLATMEYAGQLQVAFTTGILIGIGETPEERVDSLLAIREAHKRYGHIQEIILQPFKAKKGTPMEKNPEPSETDILKTIAVARILFGGKANIQSPPNLTKKFYHTLPLTGANDWGGVSPVTVDYINPEEPWPEIRELETVTNNCGFLLKERLPIYPEYVTEKTNFIPEKLKGIIQEKVDGEGYVKKVS